MAAKPVLLGGYACDQSIYETSTTQRLALGTRGELSDGRVYYYAKNGAVQMDPGKVMVCAALAANHQELATTTTALVAGSTSVTGVTLGATAAAVNLYRDGFLSVTDGGGEGHVYKIKSHPAVASAGTFTCELYDPIATASDAGTTVSLLKNLYQDIVISSTDQADVVVGVSQSAAVGAAEFAWVQTWGPCPVWHDEVSVIGGAVTIGTSVAGAVEVDDTATTVSQEPIVGYMLATGVDTEYQLCDLRIRP